MNNVTLITNDIDLYNIFTDSKLFDEVNIASQIDESISYDYLIVSDRICSINELIQYAADGLKSHQIVYLLSSTKSNQSGFNTLAALLKSHNISLLPPKLTESQILSRFCDLINLQERKINNVVVLFGADSKVGTTITALSLSESLAEQSTGSVAFLNLSGHVSFPYMETASDKGLDSIRYKVFNKILQPDELMTAMLEHKELKNLHMLPPGTKLIDFKYYRTEHIEYLIKIASGIFDVVIVDAGWYPHNSLYFGALNSTPNKYLVTTSEDSSFETNKLIRRQALEEYGIIFEKSDSEPKEEQPGNIMLIVNKVEEGTSLSNCAKKYDMILAVPLPQVPISPGQIQSGKRTLRGSTKYYDRQINKLSSLVALQVEYKLEHQKKHKGFFGIGG